jgi:hypothetical protein
MALTGYSQLDLKKATKATMDTIRSIRRNNMYTNRKYSYGVQESVYGFAKDCTIYHAIDANFSTRWKPLDLWNILSFELTGGASLQPYQGYRLHLGVDYEWLTPTKVHVYAGCQFALGLKQNTNASNDSSSVMVGSHWYVVPFMGVMYWPGKRDIQKVNRNNLTEKARYLNPTFWQLVYIKAQAGYSVLISRLEVNPSETFDKATTGHIIQNTSSCLYLSIGVGINLPTFAKNQIQ